MIVKKPQYMRYLLIENNIHYIWHSHYMQYITSMACSANILQVWYFLPIDRKYGISCQYFASMAFPATISQVWHFLPIYCKYGISSMIILPIFCLFNTFYRYIARHNYWPLLWLNVQMRLFFLSLPNHHS